MRAVILAPAAEDDLVAILTWSRETFGEAARQRYAALLTQAITDVATNPSRAGVHHADEIDVGIRVYHIMHSRRRSGLAADRVTSPRHFLLFRL